MIATPPSLQLAALRGVIQASQDIICILVPHGSVPSRRPLLEKEGMARQACAQSGSASRRGPAEGMSRCLPAAMDCPLTGARALIRRLATVLGDFLFGPAHDSAPQFFWPASQWTFPGNSREATAIHNTKTRFT